jgi:AraC family cel operon transcriptional repressor
MKKYYGVSVSEYVNGLRLNYIANMLRHSDRNILDIVYESGFNNVSWANNCFYKKYGCTMSVYRKHPQYNNDRRN